jgi:HEPN domain-containing protein
MKTQADLVKGWLLKAQGDLVACRLCVEMGRALDAACFHAQQAGEKALQAFLTA